MAHDSHPGQYRHRHRLLKSVETDHASVSLSTTGQIVSFFPFALAMALAARRRKVWVESMTCAVDEQ